MSINPKKALMAKVHIAKKELRLDDDTYRDVLWRVTGKRSCSDMSIEQLQDVVKDMEKRGFVPKTAPKHGKKPNVARRRKLLLSKIEAVLADMSLHWNYAHGMADSMFGIKRVEWLDDERLRKLTQALAVHQKRTADRDAKAASASNKKEKTEPRT